MSTEPLKVLMTETRSGSPDGTSFVEYHHGEEYVFRTPAAVDMGRVFVREGWAVEIMDEVPADVEIVAALEVVEAVAVDEPVEPEPAIVELEPAVPEVDEADEEPVDDEPESELEPAPEPVSPPEPPTKQMPKPRTRTRSRKR